MGLKATALIPAPRTRLYNWDASKFSHLRAALAAAEVGTRDARILLFGDSTGVGLGAGSGASNLTGARATNWPSQFVSQMQYVFPTKNESFTFGAIAGALTDYDPRIVPDANWLTTSNQPTPGGTMAQGLVSGALLALTPVLPFDTFDIYYLQFSAQSGFTVNVDGGSTLLTVPGGTGGYLKSTVSVTRGTHTVNITGAGSQVYIGAVIPYDSTKRGLELINGAVVGAGDTNFNIATNSWNPTNHTAVSTLAPDCLIIELTLNPAILGETVASYLTNMQAIITAYKSAGVDVLLVAGSPYGGPNSGLTKGFVNALYSLADTNNLPLLDLDARYVSYAYWNPIIPYYDLIHFTKTGYADKASAYVAAFQRAR